MLVLIPQSVNGNPLTLVTLGELVKTPKDGYPTLYNYITKDIIDEYGNQATPKAHWTLMTKNVIEGSTFKRYEEQKALIDKFNQEKGINYEVPHSLDASICIFTHWVSSKERLFNSDNIDWTYTRCQENTRGSLRNQISVGGFRSNGLNVVDLDFDINEGVGMAALTKFF